MRQALDVFLYQHPVAPAVVGLIVCAILGGYWMTRREIGQGERPEGHPAAHPFALLVQSVLVLLKDRTLLVLLLGLSLLNMAFRWWLQSRSAFATMGPAISFWRSPDWTSAAQYLQTGWNALHAFEVSLPGRLDMLGTDFGVTGILAILLSFQLLRFWHHQPPWMAGERLHRSLAMVWLCLISGLAALAGTLRWVRMSGAETDAQVQALDYALGLASVPAFALVALYAVAAGFELVVNRWWTVSSVSRRVVDAYFPWLVWSMLSWAIAVLPSLPRVQDPTMQAGALESAGMFVVKWAGTLLFAFPWLLMQRRRGFVEAAGMSLALLRDNAKVVLVFALRLAALLAPLMFVIGALRSSVMLVMIPSGLIGLAFRAIEIAGAVAVCRATVLISGQASMGLVEDTLPIAE